MDIEGRANSAHQLLLQENSLFSDLQPNFRPTNSEELLNYVKKIEMILKTMLPKEVLISSIEDIQLWMKKNLPILQWSEISDVPDCLTLFFLCTPSQEMRAENVFLNLLKKWLIPEKEVQILAFQNLYFFLPKVTTKLFFLAEVQILVEDGKDLIIIQNNLPLLAEEFVLSTSLKRHIEFVLDTKALSLDQKSTSVQQLLRKLVQKAPNYFNRDIFLEMSRFFALSSPDFRKFRLSQHIARIIVSHSWMRKKILHNLTINPDERHLLFRFIHAKLHFHFGSKSVLGIVLVVGLIDKYETFEETHVLSAVQKFIPSTQIIKNSYYFFKATSEPIKYLYLELEKKDATLFTQKEIAQLGQNLNEELKQRVEKLIPSVFMIRNEEEVMRNILLLSQELKYSSDLPQVMINFDKQTSTELCFTILIVRVIKDHDKSIEKSFQNIDGSFRFYLDRVQNVGYIRKKKPKEANVVHLWIPKERSLIRADSSVNFYSARQKALSIINQTLGEVRDYNGGMILKQGELFLRLKHAFKDIAKKNQEFLENFFFSLTPIEAQATLSLNAIETFFRLFLHILDEPLQKRENFILKVKKRKSQIFVALRTKDRSIESVISEAFNHLENFSKSFIKTQIELRGSFVQGYIYESADLSKQREFLHHLDKAIQKWTTQIKNQQELRLSFISLPPSLDPRLEVDDVSVTVLKMLFEGLTRISRDNKPSLAIAKSVNISSDQKQYVFILRDCLWSDKSRVVAYDFEYAWKKILTPGFTTPFASLFYPIKNAKLAKEGKIDLDQVGIKAIDDFTLEIELENPTPEFLELTAHPLYSPVKHTLDQIRPQWARGEELYVCNGPFKLKKAYSNGAYEFVKNPNYWDQGAVKLDRIHISITNTELANEMFRNVEIDWIGKPMHPWEPSYVIGANDTVYSKPLGSIWCSFNTQRFPFNHIKIRQAFAYAINREELLKNPSIRGIPASSPLPMDHTSNFNRSLFNGNPELACKLFEEALVELRLTRKTFPIISLIFCSEIINRKEMAQELVQQWQNVLGITCRLEAYDFYTLFPKLTHGDYQLGLILWIPWINNPVYTLNAFLYAQDQVNFSKWENLDYQNLIKKACREIYPEKRIALFREAEKILIEEVPVIPLNYELHQFMYKKYLRDPFISVTGNVDFKWAHIQKE